jgi:aryl-alcohol dehydrogenase-like predicted oxidoreductase
MKMRAMGPSGATSISVVGFGAWEAGGDAWGPNESDERVIEAVRAGLDAG